MIAQEEPVTHYRLGIDTGGTFTDFILTAPGEGIRLYKTPSTPHDPPAAVQAGLGLMSAELGCGIADFWPTAS